MKNISHLKFVCILVLTVLLTAVSLTCYADESAIAKVGTEKFSDLSLAINAAAKNGMPVLITKDFPLNQQIKLKNSTKATVTIDFQNHKLESNNLSDTGPVKHIMEVAGDFVLKNGNVDSFLDSIIINGSGSAVTIEGGKYAAPIEVSPGNSLTINSGTFQEGLGGIFSIVNASLKIKSGSFNGQCIVSSGKSSNIKVMGGHFKATGLNACVAHVENGRLSISGGSFISKEDYCLLLDGDNTISITGGTFKGKKAAIAGGKKMTISGGTFKSAVYTASNTIIKGGSFVTVINEGGKVTFKGGNVSKYIICSNGGKITIKKVAIKQKKPTHAMLYSYGKGSKITVSGGSFSSPKGYGYCATKKGKVQISKKASRKFKVKQMKKDRW